MTGLEQAPVVAHVVRNGFTESVHHGLAVVTDPDGGVEFALGDPSTPFFPRSANKPIHAVSALLAGAGPTPEALAVGCASHMGAAVHQQATRDALAALGLDESALRNVPGLPAGTEESHDWLRRGLAPTSLAHGCSGNHAIMLAGTVAGGWDPGTYDQPDHPFQRLVQHTTADLTGEEVVATGIDGCGAPVYAFGIVGLARAYGRIAGAADGPGRRVAAAMRAHPDLVAGPGRRSTEFMRRLPGIIAKSGAEAVFAAGLPDGRGIVVKITDGGNRAAGVVLAALLVQAGVARSDELVGLAAEPVLGHRDVVGQVIPAW